MSAVRGEKQYRRRPTSGSNWSKKEEKNLTPKERRRLAQLVVALAIFAGVSVGNHFFPDRLATLRDQTRNLLQQDTDFVAVFSATGEAVFEQEPVLETLGTLWVDIMGVTAQEDTAATTYLDLGISPTVTPVLGTLSSPFGMRIHPVDGTEQFHTGVDIGAERGTEILAFAQGTVEAVGENDVNGLYLSIRHDNEVTSFYAHCDSILVAEGEAVTPGQPIATVGDTGQSTGAHLHFELCYQSQNLNPIYYITVAEDVDEGT